MAKDTALPPGERTVFTVAELTRFLKELVETAFPDIWVRGEVSNLRHAPSGHSYFTIKDADAVLSAVLFRQERAALPFVLEEGVSAAFRGRLGIYAARGSYQLVVAEAEPLGLGALALAFEQLKRRLASEGLFDTARKVPVPPFPRRVGIVTSPSGAALQDILRVSGRRCPGIDIVVYPCLVQGREAAGQIAAALAQADRDGLADVLVLARGGGSLEDLWPFNEEAVARAIAACRQPVVSGVGHEVDVTIADFAADRRAATPSAAAELVFPERDAELAGLGALRERLGAALAARVAGMRRRLAGRSAAALGAALRRVFDERRQRLDELAWHARQGAVLVLARARERAAGPLARLRAADPRAPLGRGFALVRDARGRLVRDAGSLRPDDRLNLVFSRGGAAARVESVTKEPEHGQG